MFLGKLTAYVRYVVIQRYHCRMNFGKVLGAIEWPHYPECWANICEHDLLGISGLSQYHDPVDDGKVTGLSEKS